MGTNVKKFNYYDSFVKAAEAATVAAKILHETIQTRLADIERRVAEVHAAEHEADKMYHDVMNALNKAFITPIEREDIRLLASSIDDVVDAIDDIVIDFHIYNITTVRPEAVELSEIIVKSCQTLRDTLIEFKDFKKSNKIGGFIIAVNDNEEAGDRIYQKAMRNLFTGNCDPVEIIKWRKIFEVMEHCCDICEHVADVIEAVMLKNS